MPLSRLTSSDVGASARAKINAIMDLADQVPNKGAGSDVASLLSTVSGLATTVAQNSTAIGANSSAIGALQTQVSGLVATTSGKASQASVDTLAATVGQNTTAIAGKASQGALDVVSATVAQQATAIAAKAAQAALTQETADRQNADAAETAARIEADALLESKKLNIVDAQAVRGRDGGIYPEGKPGDGFWYFTDDVAPKEPSAYPDLDLLKIVSTSFGRGYRLTGAGYVVSKKFWPIEPTGIHTLGGAFVRTGAPDDPTGDTVRLGLLFYDASHQLVADIVVKDWAAPDLNTRLSFAKRYTRLAILPDGVAAPPSGATCVRPYFRGFGGPQVTVPLSLSWDHEDGDFSLATIEAEAAADVAQQAAQQTGADRAQTTSDRAQTGQDRTQTSADRAQTGLDRAALSTLPIANSDAPGGLGSLVPSQYASRRAAYIRKNQTATLLCNPSAGHDFQDMFSWVAARHIIEEAGFLGLTIADGYHPLSTFGDLSIGRQISIGAEGAADVLQITGMAFSLVSGTLFEATIFVNSDIPARVVPGYAVGCQNCKGDGGAEAVNGALIVKTVAADRRSLTGRMRSQGVTPTNTTTLDNVSTLGLAANRLIVPRACLRVNSAGYDGSAREGFLNIIDGGGQMRLRGIGLSYDGLTDEHDLLFGSGCNALLDVEACVLAGAGDKIVRLANGAYARLFGTCIGGGELAQEAVTAQQLSKANLIRCSIGSVSGTLLYALDGSRQTTSQCIFASATFLARTTYSDSSIMFANSRLRHAATGALMSKGTIGFDSLTSIEKCIDPLSIGGVGIITGLPAIANNVNAPIAQNTYLSGGYWASLNVAPNASIRATVSLDFGPIAPGASESITFSMPGALLTSVLSMSPRLGYPDENIKYESAILAVDTGTLKATNQNPSGGATINSAARFWYGQIARV